MKKIIFLSIMCAICTQAQSQSWNITGNSGTNATTNFIGTSDAKNLKIRTNNIVRMNITSGGKIAIGNFTPVFKLDVKSGSINTDSLYRIGGETVLSVKGSGNTFVGIGNGFSNTTGSLNTGTGSYALYSNTEGYYNTATGSNALFYNSTGHENTANGYQALFSNTTGFSNTASGMYALYSNTEGYSNTASGMWALNLNTTGIRNTANGSNALKSNTTGYSNTSIGSDALYANTTASQNVAIGNNALFGQSYSNSGIPWTSGNVAIGYEALLSNQPVSTGTGFYNTAVGTIAMRSNTTGYYNTGIGQGVLYSNTTGYLNAACGRGALFNNTEGIANTASGAFSLNSNITGSYNTANGYLALYSANSSNNTATGYHALYSTTNATRNTAIGAFAGSTYTNSSYNTFAGGYADANAAAHFNSSVIGDAAMITASSQARIGDGGVTSIGGYAGWTTLPSDGRFKKNIQENVPGIEFISKLRPVTYTVDVHGVNQYIGVNENGKENIYEEKSHIRYTGFIAQEVETAAKETGFDFSGVDAPKNNKDVYGLRYAEFVVPLVKAVQELNEELKSEVRSLKSENEMIKSVLSEEQRQKLKALSVGKSPLRGDLEGPLFQNSPNPFNTQTEIKFILPSTFRSAQLIITDANGKQARNEVLKSSSSVIIKASELSAGTYSYSLVIDGINIDTKQMILTK